MRHRPRLPNNAALYILARHAMPLILQLSSVGVMLGRHAGDGERQEARRERSSSGDVCVSEQKPGGARPRDGPPVCCTSGRLTTLFCCVACLSLDINLC